MLSERSKKAMLSLLPALLWIAVPVTAALVAVPAFQRFRELQAELESAGSVLSERLQQREAPTEAAISEAAGVKEGLIAQVRMSNEFFMDIQDRVLERRILDSRLGDPYRVAARFRELEQNLSAVAGSERFLSLGAVTDWAARADGSPDEDQFEMLEKKSCIAEEIVYLLADPEAGSSVTIRTLAVGDPYRPAGRPPVPMHADWRVVRMRVFPVEVELSIPIGRLADIFEDITTVTPGDEKPFIVLRSLEIEARARGGGNRPLVRLDIDVLDFYLPDDF